VSEPEAGHPYRQATPDAEVERLPVRRRNLVIAAVVGVAAGGITAVLGGPFEWIGGSGLAAGGQAFTVLVVRSRRRALAAFARLPFPIRHDPELDAVPQRNPPRSVREVRVVLAAPLDDADAERAGRDIVARVPGLVATVDGDTFTLTSWPLADDHMAKLQDVLGTWGRDLHARHRIKEAVVVWTYGGTG
jgi:hypothetical protein